MGCEHKVTARGANIPRVYGSGRSEVCASCGWFRMIDHHGNSLGQYLSRWCPGEEYEAASAEQEPE